MTAPRKSSGNFSSIFVIAASLGFLAFCLHYIVFTL